MKKNFDVHKNIEDNEKESKLPSMEYFEDQSHLKVPDENFSRKF